MVIQVHAVLDFSACSLHFRGEAWFTWSLVTFHGFRKMAVLGVGVRWKNSAWANQLDVVALLTDYKGLSRGKWEGSGAAMGGMHLLSSFRWTSFSQPFQRLIPWPLAHHLCTPARKQEPVPLWTPCTCVLWTLGCNWAPKWERGSNEFPVFKAPWTPPARLRGNSSGAPGVLTCLDDSWEHSPSPLGEIAREYFSIGSAASWSRDAKLRFKEQNLYKILSLWILVA